jgi:hypothetical protein
MADREVLERDGGSTGKEGAQERPETDYEYHQGPPRIRHDGLDRDSTGSAMEGLRESSGKASRWSS